MMWLLLACVLKSFMLDNRFGRYELKSALGQGGMATVYLAHDPYIGRDVALKVMKRDLQEDDTFRSRFKREARTIATLEHPAIVPVYDFGEENKQLFLVMRLMKGGTLAERIQQRPFSLHTILPIVQRIGSALDHAHQQGVIHRDLKPSNILFDEYSNAYLSDFGIVKLVQSSTNLTGSSVVGTPAYISPEQIHGDADVDGRADVYTLGVILFEALTGQKPYRADTPVKQLMAHILDPIPPILQLNPALPPGLDTIIQRALAKDRAQRYATAAELVAELRILLPGDNGYAVAEEEASPPVSTYRPENTAVPQDPTISLPGKVNGETKWERPLPASPQETSRRLNSSSRLPTPLIGRQQEQRELAERLREHPLVTLIGPGGAGKTRLATRVATDLAHTFADGAIFVALAPVMPVEGVVPAIAAALGVRLSGAVTPEDELLTLLSERQLLLVLDNMEHLLEAAPFVARLVQHAPGVRLLVTSRERLRLQAEQVVYLGGLSLPQTGSSAIAASDAVHLFVERARRMSSDFTLTPQNEPLVAQICHQLDGMPLALELAAAQVSFLPLATLVQRLDQALPLLVDGARDLPPRQRTMRAAIQWSHDLLSADEQILLTRLAVFMGGFSLAAAESVCVGDDLPPEQLLTLLRRLVDHSLVVCEATETDVRYRLLVPIRQFAREQLKASGALAEVQARHAAHYLNLALEAELNLQSADQLIWLALLERDFPNLRAAMSWFLEQQDMERATRLGWALWLFLWMRGLLSEGRHWVEQILPQTEDGPLAVRGRALLLAMVVGFGQASYAWAVSFIDEALAIFHELKDEANLAHATSLSALNMAGFQQLEAAEPLMELGVQRYLAVGSNWNAAMLLTYWAAIPRNRGEFERARQLIEQALQLARQQGDRVTVYSSLFNLGSIAQAQGAHREAMRQFREALSLAAEVGDTGNIVPCLEGIAGTAVAQGDVAYAVRLWAAAEAMLERNEMAIYTYAPDREQHLQTVEKARQLVSAERWAALWQEGRSLTPDEAIHIARHTDPERLLPDKSDESGRASVAAAHGVLTPREVEVLQLMAQGQRNRTIAERLVISEKTVQNHVSSIFAKLGVEDRSHAIIWAMQHDLIDKNS